MHYPLILSHIWFDHLLVFMVSPICLLLSLSVKCFITAVILSVYNHLTGYTIPLPKFKKQGLTFIPKMIHKIKNASSPISYLCSLTSPPLFSSILYTSLILNTCCVIVTPLIILSLFLHYHIIIILSIPY